MGRQSRRKKEGNRESSSTPTISLQQTSRKSVGKLLRNSVLIGLAAAGIALVDDTIRHRLLEIVNIPWAAKLNREDRETGHKETFFWTPRSGMLPPVAGSVPIRIENVPFTVNFVDAKNYDPRNHPTGVNSFLAESGIAEWSDHDRNIVLDTVHKASPILSRVFKGTPTAHNVVFVRGDYNPTNTGNASEMLSHTGDQVVITTPSDNTLLLRSTIVHELGHVFAHKASLISPMIGEGIAVLAEDIVSRETRNFVPQNCWSSIQFGENGARYIGINTATANNSYAQFEPLALARYVAAADLMRQIPLNTLQEIIRRAETEVQSSGTPDAPKRNMGPELFEFLKKTILDTRLPLTYAVPPTAAPHVTMAYSFMSDVVILSINRSENGSTWHEELTPCDNCSVQFYNLDTAASSERIPLPRYTPGVGSVISHEVIRNSVGEGNVKIVVFGNSGSGVPDQLLESITLSSELPEITRWQADLLHQDSRVPVIVR